MHIGFRDCRTSLVSKSTIREKKYYSRPHKRVPTIDPDHQRSLRLVLSIGFLHLLRRVFGVSGGLFRWFWLFSYSFGIYNVDEVIANIASTVDLGDSRLEEFGVMKHPSRSISIGNID